MNAEYNNWGMPGRKNIGQAVYEKRRKMMSTLRFNKVIKINSEVHGIQLLLWAQSF